MLKNPAAFLGEFKYKLKWKNTTTNIEFPCVKLGYLRSQFT